MAAGTGPGSSWQSLLAPSASALAPLGAAGLQHQQQQQQQLGYGQNEHAHLLAAIHQPLFIQTPLQVMLESLLEQLQLQAGLIGQLQDKVAGLERGKLSASELLGRVQLLEERLGAAPSAAGSGPSPFVQAQVLARLGGLEQQAAGLEGSVAELAFKADQVLQPRLQLCEQRLAGCHNIAGALMAVDAMAAELGVVVPHPTCMSTHAQLQASPTQQQQQQEPGGRSEFQEPRGLDGLPPLSTSLTQPQAAAAAGGAGPLTVSRQQVLQQQIDEGRQQLSAAQQQLQDLQQQVGQLAAGGAAAQDTALGLLAGLQDGHTALGQRLGQQVAALRAEMRPALQAAEFQQTSVAELSQLGSRVEAAAAVSASLAKELAALKAKELTEVSTKLAELTRRLNRVTGAPGALSDTEKALAAAQAQLRDQLEALGARLVALEAAERSGKHHAAAQQELQELEGSVRDRASSEDLRALVNRAVRLAVAAHSSSISGQQQPWDGAAASKTRCLVCDHALRDASPPRCGTAPLPHQLQTPGGSGGCGVADACDDGAACGSSSHSMGLLLPYFDAFRPVSAAASIVAAATASASASAGCSGSASRGGEAVPAGAPPHGGGNRTGRPGTAAAAVCAASTSGGSSSSGPMGPGLNAAQLRQRSAAQRSGRPLTAAAAAPGAGRSAAGSSCRRTAGPEAVVGSAPPSSTSAAAAAAAGAGGSSSAVAQPMMHHSSGGLLVADLVSSNLCISGAAHARGGTALQEEAGDATGSSGVTDGGLRDAESAATTKQQQQQHASESREGSAGLDGGRPSTAAGAWGAGVQGRAPGGRRTPVFV